MPLLIRPIRCRRIFLPFALVLCVVLCLSLGPWISPLNEFHLSSPLLVQTKTTSASSRQQYQTPSIFLGKVQFQSLESNSSLNQHRSQRDAILQSGEVRQLLPPGKPCGVTITQEELSGGTPNNVTLVTIRDQIREMTRHAWNSYAKYAWGYNELKPISKTSHQPSVLGAAPLGATIVDAMDTLYIMGLTEEFQAARKYVAEELIFDVSGQVSVFEFTIRYLGGLLTAFTFTLDRVFLDKAVELARRLLPAFNTPSGLPMSLINLKTGQCRMFSWSRKKCAILSEMGTMHMEFMYLSELTGDPIYAKHVEKVREVISSLERPEGLFYNFVDPQKPTWCAKVASLGALGDSFYEYLLKEWIRTDHADVDARALYDTGIRGLYENGVFKTSEGGHLYVGTYSDGSVSTTMEHLACFAGGMLALGSTGPKDVWFERGVELGRTCQLSYESSATGLGSESFDFSPGIEAVPVKKNQKVYFLRPETIETYFYLWRLTKNVEYRIAALKVVQALEKYTRVPGGYSGLKDVQSVVPDHDDVQQSFFLAETLKYLYLIFSDDTLLPLDRWVFNSEAHPLPIHNKVCLGSGIWPKSYSSSTVSGG